MDRLPSADLPPAERDAARHPTFEETYPRYEFAELVRLTVAFAAWLVKGRRRLEKRRAPRAPRWPSPDRTPSPAEWPGIRHGQGVRNSARVVHVPAGSAVKALRRRLGMSQAWSAASPGFNLDAVQSWKQGRRRPEGPARILLEVIEHEPEAVRRALVA